MLRAPRALERYEIEALLAGETPARLATLDADGFLAQLRALVYSAR